MTNQLTVKDRIKNFIPSLKDTLKARGTDVQSFQNNAIMAASNIPDIANNQVNIKTVADVCARAAEDGVLLDGQQAAIVIGWNSKTRQKEAQYRLMAGGVIHKMYKSGNFTKIICNVVREGENCSISYVTDGVPVEHSPNMTGEAGDVIGAYAVAKMTNGEWTDPVYMSRAEIESVRDNYSQTNKDGQHSKMWTASFDEAAKKTVLHRAKKRWPLTSDVRTLLDNEFEEPIEVEETVQEDAPKPKKQSAKKSEPQPDLEHDEDGVIDVEAEPEYEEVNHNQEQEEDIPM